MNFTNTRADGKVRFKDIKIGNIFERHGNYYMKIKEIYTPDECDDEVYDCFLNAVSMSSGHVFAFDTDSYVKPVSHELVIK